MYLKVTYGWFAEENRGKTEELDKALQDSLDELGFFQTKARFDMATGERRLEFETEESFYEMFWFARNAARKIHNTIKSAGNADKTLVWRVSKIKVKSLTSR